MLNPISIKQDLNSSCSFLNFNQHISNTILNISSKTITPIPIPPFIKPKFHPISIHKYLFFIFISTNEMFKSKIKKLITRPKSIPLTTTSNKTINQFDMLQKEIKIPGKKILIKKGYNTKYRNILLNKTLNLIVKNSHKVSDSHFTKNNSNYLSRKSYSRNLHINIP